VGYDAAAARFRELGIVFWLGVTLFENAEWLLSHDRADEAEPLFNEARGIFEELRALPWLERIDAVLPATSTVSPR
jgi:hypothetical protein